jgi:hypothetical protein
VALATYKDLSVDAVDPAVLGAFWSAVLGLDLHPEGPGQVAHLTGPTPGHTIWHARVPEPKTVKHRVHLDVNVASVEELTRLGATVLDAGSFPWTVLADPEGGEFCAFVREGEIAAPLYEVVMDCADTAEACAELATWWADVLGARVEAVDPDGSSVEAIPGAPFEYLVLGVVPEPKTVKNRVHLDVTTPDLDALVAAGATVLRPQDDEIRWTVLADPAGNEFCAFLEA